MNTTNELVKHIEALNAKTQAWVDAAPGRWSTMLVTDAAHWAEYGITTVEEFEHHTLVSDVYEMTREVHGFKPSWKELSKLSTDVLRKELDYLTTTAKMHREEQDKVNAAELAKEAALCEEHGVDTETLVRWGVLEAYTPWRSSSKWMNLEQELYMKRFETAWDDAMQAAN